MPELSPTVSASASDAGRDLEQGVKGQIVKDSGDLEKCDVVQVPPMTYATLTARPQSYQESTYRQSFGTAETKVSFYVASTLR